MASEEQFNSDYLSEPETNNSLSSQFPQNESFPYPGNVTIILQGSLHYNVFEIVFLAIIMTAMIIVIVIGNMLVVIAIFTENNLKSVQVSILRANLSRRRIVKARPFDKLNLHWYHGLTFWDWLLKINMVKLINKFNWNFSSKLEM